MHRGRMPFGLRVLSKGVFRHQRGGEESFGCNEEVYIHICSENVGLHALYIYIYMICIPLSLPLSIQLSERGRVILPDISTFGTADYRCSCIMFVK